MKAQKSRTQIACLIERDNTTTSHELLRIASSLDYRPNLVIPTTPANISPLWN